MKIVNVRDAAVLVSRHGSEIRPLIDRTTSAITQCSVAEERLMPGQSVSPHFHRETEEVYYILEGEGMMTVGDESAGVIAGDAIMIPFNTVHSLENTGTSPMRIVLVCGPAFSRADENFVDLDNSPASESASR
jgi:mannose-6-phosphate isomerase-like protein (cupin superfamily)